MALSSREDSTRRHIEEQVAELIGSGALPVAFTIPQAAKKIRRSRSLLYSIFGEGRDELLKGVLRTGWAMVEDRLKVSRGRKASALEQLHAMVDVIINAAFYDGRDKDRIIAWFLCRRGGGLDLSDAVIEEYRTLNTQVDALLRAAAAERGAKGAIDPRKVAALRGILLGAVDGPIWDLLLSGRFKAYRPRFKQEDFRKQVHGLIEATVELLMRKT